MGSFMGRDILSIQDFSKDELRTILNLAKEFKKTPPGAILKGKLLCSCFFEPSTRTRLSFEAAMKRLGGDVIGFTDAGTTSAKKGESLSDSMRVIGSYCDLIVMRHPLEGSARSAAESTKTPLINAGDGANEHPTQTFLDLFTMEECAGRLEGLNIIFCGDLKYSRTIHSLAYAMKHFGGRIFFVSPEALSIPDKILGILRDAGVSFTFHREIDEVIGKADILYMTRIQEERFPDKMEYEALKHSFQLTPEHLKKGKAHLRVLAPGPRLSEITTAVDKEPQAAYFTQAENGVYVRQALLQLILGEK